MAFNLLDRHPWIDRTAPPLVRELTTLRFLASREACHLTGQTSNADGGRIML